MAMNYVIIHLASAAVGILLGVIVLHVSIRRRWWPFNE
jgi:hypothetical protein